MPKELGKNKQSEILNPDVETKKSKKFPYLTSNYQTYPGGTMFSNRFVQNFLTYLNNIL